MAGETGVIISPEILPNGASDRWIIQLETEDIVLSLYTDEFQVID
jgi:hypothetical protein